MPAGARNVLNSLITDGCCRAAAPCCSNHFFIPAITGEINNNTLRIVWLWHCFRNKNVWQNHFKQKKLLTVVLYLFNCRWLISIIRSSSQSGIPLFPPAAAGRSGILMGSPDTSRQMSPSPPSVSVRPPGALLSAGSLVWAWHTQPEGSLTAVMMGHLTSPDLIY